MASVDTHHDPYRILEPNPADGRGITSAYLTEFADYLLAQGRWGRTPGLLPMTTRRGHGLARLSAPDQLQLDAIAAIGENGHALLSFPGADTPRIKPLDLRPLPTGDHKVYACLDSERVPCGEPLAARRQAGEVPARVPRHRASRIVLAVEDQRSQYLDWLPVALVHREGGAGVPRTRLEDAFHPPVTDLEAWLLPNPLQRLVERGLQALESEAESTMRALARIELIVLRNISQRGAPQLAFLQAQRCLAYLRAAQLRQLVLPGQIEQMDFDALGLWKFFAALDVALRTPGSNTALPPQIELDGDRFTLLPGELRQDDNLWVWDAPRAGFQMNRLALYLPYSTRGELPVVRCGRALHEANNFPAATEALEVSGPGTALILESIQNAVDRTYLTVVVPAEGLRFEQKLSQGHGLYYW